MTRDGEFEQGLKDSLRSAGCGLRVSSARTRGSAIFHGDRLFPGGVQHGPHLEPRRRPFDVHSPASHPLQFGISDIKYTL